MKLRMSISRLCISGGLVAGQLLADGRSDEYIPARLAGAWRDSSSGPPRETGISLRSLEREARSAAKPELLTLGDLTDISGVTVLSSEHDVLILGTRGDSSVEPILLDELVTALRIGPAFYMSLDPMAGWDRHRLRYGPKALDGTSFLAGLTRADYFVKAMAVGLIESPVPASRSISDLYACKESTGAEETHTQTNVFFQPGKVAWERSHDATTLRLSDLVVTLMAGQDTSSLQRDFAAGFNRHYAEILAAHPRVFKRLRNLFELHQIAHLLHGLAASGAIDLTYWLQEYRGESQAIPTSFPGFPPKRFATFCHGRSGFSERTLDISGGVVSMWTEGIPGFEERRFAVYVSGSNTLVLRPDKSFLRKSRRDPNHIATVRGTYSWSGAEKVHLVSDSGEQAVMTVHGSSLLADDGASFVDLFSSEREGEATLASLRPLHSGSKELPSVESAWFSHKREMTGSLRQELVVEDATQRTQVERQLLQEIERVLDLEGLSQGIGKREEVEKVEADTMERVVDALIRASKTPSALAELWQALETRADTAGAPAADGTKGLAYGRVLRLAAERCHASARVAEALELGGRALAVIDRTVGSETADYADALAFLGAVYSETGDYDRGEGLLLKAKQLFENVAPDDKRRPLALYALGDHYEALGLYETAISSYQSGISLLRTFPSGNSAWIAQGLGSVAWNLLESGDVVQAQRVAEEALALASQTSAGLDLYLSKILAGVHYRREEYEAALAILEAALGRVAGKLYDSGPARASLSNDLGLIYWSLGRKQKARETLRQAVSLHEAGAFEAHASRARILINYGSILALDHSYREAEARLEQGILIAREVLGDTHPDHIRGLEARAFLERSRGLWSKAQATQADVDELSRSRSRSGKGIDFLRMMDVLDSLLGDSPEFR